MMIKIKQLSKYIVLIAVYFYTSIAGAQPITVSENFDSGTIGEKVDVFTDAAGDTNYSTESYGAGQGAELNINANSDGWGTWGGRLTFQERGFSDLVKGDEIWIRLRTKFPVDFDYNAMPFLKFLRFGGGSAANGIEGYNDIYIRRSDNGDGTGRNEAFYYTKEAQQALVSYFGDDNDRIVKGQWETYEWYLKFSDVTADTDPANGARVRFWKNDNLLTEVTNIATLETASSYINAFLLFTYWNGNSPQTQKMYIDDLVITANIPPNTDSNGNPMIGAGAANIPKAPVLNSN